MYTYFVTFIWRNNRFQPTAIATGFPSSSFLHSYLIRFSLQKLSITVYIYNSYTYMSTLIGQAFHLNHSYVGSECFSFHSKNLLFVVRTVLKVPHVARYGTKNLFQLSITVATVVTTVHINSIHW